MMGDFDSIELRILRRAHCVPTLFPVQGYVLTAFRGCQRSLRSLIYSALLSIRSLMESETLMILKYLIVFKIPIQAIQGDYSVLI